MGKVNMYTDFELKNLRTDIDALPARIADAGTERSSQLLSLKLDLLIAMLEPDGAFVA